MTRFLLSPLAIDTATFVRGLMSVGAGACCTFEGWVRNYNEGKPVRCLAYQAYPALAASEGARILDEARRRFAIIDGCCVHRTGELEIGELAVWVGVSGAHRDAAFAACRWIIDEVKQNVPIWKREVYVDGTSGWLYPDGSPVE